ncbi:hypothetical protein M947_10700 [Sulfurimonas hongkongensis]|uniref:Uncharacterized protein n=1 Tax=Sulfurimonas hongkongensis TaxID=1172190 RepID=T0JC95_9BACT|nr:hypothetical protein [Sulfurimonas hongkongensis]EQB34467.1 hypothetical protein M947_10700 [Sulfurimonas hongkongensis]
MAKKRVEPFNPWPGFVDLFASVIMVILMFMLVLIINISYYSQFKYKISYTGTVPIKEETIVKSVDVVKTAITEVELKKEKEKEKKIISAGLDYSNIENNNTKQDNLIYEDWMVIKYLNSEVILDQKSIKEIEKFLLSAKEKYFGHYVSIYIKEPQNQVSASVAKQLALSRILNIRNLIRKLDYANDDVVIRLKEKIPQNNLVEHESGYAVILINRKR